MNLSYVTIGSGNLEKSIPFFTSLFESEGITKLFDHPRGGVLFGKNEQIIIGVLTPFDRAAASAGNGTMVAFEVSSEQAVDTLHAKAISLGAENVGSPGERGPGFYMSYFRDLDGNKFCICHLTQA